MPGSYQYSDVDTATETQYLESFVLSESAADELFRECDADIQLHASRAVAAR